VKLTDDVKQRKQKHFKQYRTAKQKLTNKENLVRFLHRGKPRNPIYRVCRILQDPTGSCTFTQDPTQDPKWR